MNQRDYDITQKDYAVYLPAISSFYSTYISKQRRNEFVPQDRIPKGFENGIEGMNFLNPEQGYFKYKHALYSAGHAQLDLDKAIEQDSMLQERDRGYTTILGDSGGFQIGKGIIKFDWQDFKGKGANETRNKILNWLELTADWSMTLDVPTWASNELHREKTGLKSFEDCLEATKFNNDYFAKNRLGNTKFLNVLQGNSLGECDQWYEAVKDQPFEGWAMGGQNMCNMPIILHRLLTMRDEGKLEGKDWMHFLGTAPLDWACYLTSIQRVLRKHCNPNITLSFDCASPYIAVAYGLAYTIPSHRTDKWSIIMEKATDNKVFAGTDLAFPWPSSIGDRLTLGDVCYYKQGVPNWEAIKADGITERQLTRDAKVMNDPKYWITMGDLNKIGKVGSTSWDSFSYALYMAHNTEVHIQAVQRANQLMDMECARHKPDWRSWGVDNKAHPKISEWVPNNVLYFDRFVQELFEMPSKEAHEVIKFNESHTDDPNYWGAAYPFLKQLQGGMQRGKRQDDNYNKHFVEVDELGNEFDNATEEQLNNPNDEKIVELENSIHGNN
jgi:hypothetical protein